MVLENGETVTISGKRGTFTVGEPITNAGGEEGYRLTSNETLKQHFFRDADITSEKKKGRA